jgi:hypothetical protein
VRRQLASFGVRPSLSRLWIETWQWAHQITNSYVFPRWPLASEIAAQYMVLLLLEMQGNHALKLPYRAAEQQPESVRLRLTAGRSLPSWSRRRSRTTAPPRHRELRLEMQQGTSHDQDHPDHQRRVR